jgi:cell division protein FtsW
MRKSSRHADRILGTTLLILVIGGVFIFLSASLGLFASDGASFADVARNQLLFGLVGGGAAFLFAFNTPYAFWRRISLYLWIASLVLTLCVFVPGIGITLNGAHRWIGLGPITVQPSEFLKLAYILYIATWLSGAKSKLGDFRFGLLPYLIITGITGAALIIQPDNDTFLITAATGLIMYVASGTKLRDLAILLLIGIIGAAIIVFAKPYVAERVMTFLNPDRDPQGASYQLKQSLLAVGAGEVSGRGFGQSIQKFGKLPEPISDSIFSVFSEEFGFIGSLALVFAYLVFALRGLWVAARAPDLFGGLLAVGIVILVSAQSYLNISSMLGLFPLSGLPLVFISHGGSAMVASLAAAGMLLSVSRNVPA